MTDTDSLSEDQVEHPLLQPLRPEQLALLKLIWTPIYMHDAWPDDPPDWPKWDYVSREFRKQYPDEADAEQVIETLPLIPGGPYSHGPYGLTWRNSNADQPPAPGEQVGLTIAGIAAMSKATGLGAGLADQLASLIGYLEQKDSGLTTHPYRVTEADELLSDLLGAFTVPRRGRTYVLSERIIGTMLRHEYAPLVVIPTSDEGTFKVMLGRISLRRYRGLSGADDYLNRISAFDAASRPATPYSSPLTLVQTLDYLSLVLAADAVWPKGLRLVSAPDLQSAAALSAVVANRHEFETSMMGLLNVINDLGVPDIPTDVVAAKFNNKQPASMMRLEYWLQQRLAFTDGFPRALSALGVLRAARRIRVEGAHSNENTRAEAASARVKLGLPEVLTDWFEAWSTIQERVAGALDVIRQEVQLAPTEAEID